MACSFSLQDSAVRRAATAASPSRRHRRKSTLTSSNVHGRVLERASMPASCSSAHPKNSSSRCCSVLVRLKPCAKDAKLASPTCLHKLRHNQKVCNDGGKRCAMAATPTSVIRPHCSSTISSTSKDCGKWCASATAPASLMRSLFLRQNLNTRKSFGKATANFSTPSFEIAGQLEKSKISVRNAVAATASATMAAPTLVTRLHAWKFKMSSSKFGLTAAATIFTAASSNPFTLWKPKRREVR
mmetsp:Transcript_25509/g.46686  ORF Transcript_25509/g.46686 Transcript_25509/m.46686 type:complete len:242 (+) Transcript_25509:171-896(+)